MTAYNSDVQVASVVSSAAVAADKLTIGGSVPMLILRWGVIAGGTAITGGTMDVALDIIPKDAGTRVNGSVSSGFDVAGGSITNTDVPLGDGAYHEPKFDPSDTVSPGTGVSKLGYGLLVQPGDLAILEVTGAGTGGATSLFFIEYRALAFNAAQATNFVKIAS